MFDMKKLKELGPERAATPAIRAAVGAYLVTRAYAETMRERVDETHKDILTECPVYADQFDRTRQILKSGDLYLCSNDDLCQDFYDEANHRLRKLKIKPDDMPNEHCPALVAEEIQRNTRRLLIEIAEQETFHGLTFEKLICSQDAIGNLDKYIDLLCGLVCSLPDWEKLKTI